jgi:uncharacterized membrane protein
MIFIWPFLGQLQLENHSHNVKILLRLVGIFCAISLLAIFALLIGGQMVASVLFNSYYPADVISLTGALSIVYKLLLLIITAASLYMIVMRRYRVTTVAIASTLALLIATRMIGSGASINNALTILDIAMAIATLLSLLLVLSDTSAEKIAKQESL